MILVFYNVVYIGRSLSPSFCSCSKQLLPDSANKPCCRVFWVLPGTGYTHTGKRVLLGPRAFLVTQTAIDFVYSWTGVFQVPTNGRPLTTSPALAGPLVLFILSAQRGTYLEPLCANNTFHSLISGESYAGSSAQHCFCVSFSKQRYTHGDGAPPQHTRSNIATWIIMSLINAFLWLRLLISLPPT